MSVECSIVLNVGELVKLFLLEQHADFGSLARLLLREHLVDVSQVQVTLNRGDEGCGNLLCIQSFPVHPIEEYVTLDIIYASRTEPLSWLRNLKSVSKKNA